MKLYKEFDHFKHSTKLLAYYLRYTVCFGVKEKKKKIQEVEDTMMHLI